MLSSDKVRLPKKDGVSMLLCSLNLAVSKRCVSLGQQMIEDYTD